MTFKDEKDTSLQVSYTNLKPYKLKHTEYCRAGNKYLGATKKSIELVDVYQRLATKLGIGFIALSSIVVGVDGIHIDAGQHAIVANLVYETFTK